MPTPYRFASREELKVALRQYPWAAWFAMERWKERNSSLEDIIDHAVSGNTFRAFHHMKCRPSETFRRWAIKALTERRLENLQRVESQSAYTDWLYGLADSFRACWQRKMHQQIPYGPSLKLPNLLMKRLGLYRQIPKQAFDRFIWYLEIPLDSYSIQAVANVAASFPDASAIGRIPRTATMNFVTSIQMYEAFQAGIRELAKKAGVPPITLDCLAWDGGHEGKTLSAAAGK